ncbi:arylesterase [Marinospirillum minutulum]|uniref:arylesterase n=1 Tax=Marinospirillum minutulum TaxID=64974 RepID=UPI00040FD08F|nr:arylesterase [Marinospirillum minutulum]
MFYPWKNKVISWLAAFLLLLLMNSGSLQAAERPVILVMGDSLSAAYNLPASAGWVSLLEERLKNQTNWQVVNASISGETTSGGLTRLPGLLRQHQPDLVLLELGANDGLRGLPPKLISNNLEKMLTLSQESGAKVMLIGILLPPNYGPAYLAQFEQTYPNLAKKHQLPLVPFLLEGVADKPSLMQADGLHPTAEAQPIILETVWLELKALLN